MYEDPEQAARVVVDAAAAASDSFIAAEMMYERAHEIIEMLVGLADETAVQAGEIADEAELNVVFVLMEQVKSRALEIRNHAAWDA